MKTIKIEFRSNGYLNVLYALVDLRPFNEDFYVLAISGPFSNMALSFVRVDSPLYKIASKLPSVITLKEWNIFLDNVSASDECKDNSKLLTFISEQ